MILNLGLVAFCEINLKACLMGTLMRLILFFVFESYEYEYAI